MRKDLQLKNGGLKALQWPLGMYNERVVAVISSDSYGLEVKGNHKIIRIFDMNVRLWKKPPRAELLSDVEDNYIDFEVPMTRLPVAPICVVSDEHIATSDNSLAVRRSVLLPCLIILCAACYFLGNHFHSSWVKNEQALLGDVERKKIKYGGKYFLETENINDMAIYYSVETGRLPVLQYLELRYQKNEFPYFPQYVKQVYFDLVALITFVLGIPYLVFRIITFRRRAPLYFDRDRGLVYTWHLGCAWVQHYKQLEFVSNNRSLRFLLYSAMPGSGLRPRLYSIQPSGSLFINGEACYRPVLSAICQFMDKGKERVWNSNWSDIKGFLLLSDDMPADLNEQIEELLKRLQ